MVKEEWEKIRKEDVLVAIAIYKTGQEGEDVSKNTFLSYNEIIYPAKHIRGLAYWVYYGINKPWEEYNDGDETTDFFEKLGFEIIVKSKYENYNIKSQCRFVDKLVNRVKELDNIDFVDPNEWFDFKIYARPAGDKNGKHNPIEFKDRIGNISTKIFDKYVKEMQSKYPNEIIEIRDFNFKVNDLKRKGKIK